MMISFYVDTTNARQSLSSQGGLVRRDGEPGLGGWGQENPGTHLNKSTETEQRSSVRPTHARKIN
jgi:hypothetical protein